MKDNKEKIKRRTHGNEHFRDRAITASAVLCVFAAVMAAAGGYLLETDREECLPVIVDIIEETSAEETAEETVGTQSVQTEPDNIDNIPETRHTGENAESSAESQTDNSDGEGLININTATAEELEDLYGIGEKLAAAIIEYRNKQPFESIEDIMNVKGIGEGKFERIKDRITC